MIRTELARSFQVSFSKCILQNTQVKDAANNLQDHEQSVSMTLAHQLGSLSSLT